MPTFQPDSFIAAMFVGSIDYYFIRLPVILTLLADHEVSTKQNLLWCFLKGFMTDQDGILYGA